MAATTIELPPPSGDGPISLERSLSQRQSVRAFAPNPLTVAQVSQMLWAAQGLTRNGVFRTAPSAGALYPLELYLVAGKVEGLEPGVYHYLSHDHGLTKTTSGDLRSELSVAALSQRAIISAPATLVMCAVYDRVTAKYGRRGDRYVHMETGHAAQNVALQAVALGLASVPIGAFRDAQVQQVLGLSPTCKPLYLLPVGVP